MNDDEPQETEEYPDDEPGDDDLYEDDDE